MESLHYLRWKLRHALPKGNARRLLVLAFLVLALPVSILGIQQIQRYRAGASVASVNLYFEPALQSLPPDSNFKLMANARTNEVAFIRAEFTFDPTKVHLASEITPNPLLATIIQKTSMASANTTGVATLVIAKSPVDQNSLPTGIFEIANVSITSVTHAQNSAATLSYVNSTVQLVDLQSQILPFTTQQASLALNSTATGTVSPSITNATTSTPVPTTGAMNLQITDFAFSPSTLSIPLGSTVTWTNNAPTPHTVTSDTSLWDSGSIASGQMFSHTFTSAGTFTYHCNFHPSMTAAITVTGGQATSTPTVTSTPTNTPTQSPTSIPVATHTSAPTATNTPLATATSAPKTGDVNGDGVVGITDIGIIIDFYGSSPPGDSRADLNKDGKVNIVDIGIVVENYGL